MARTIGPGELATAILSVQLPLSLIAVACTAECMNRESGPALNVKGFLLHTPLAQLKMPWPFLVPSFHSPSYLSPVGQSAWTLRQGQRRRDHVIHTIAPGINASAMLGALLPLAVILLSCRAQCMHTGSGPALNLKKATWHIPMAPDQTPLPCCLPSFHSPSYLFPAGQSAWRLSQSQRTRDHVIHTIGPAINASAMLKVILPLAVVLVSCRAQCMHTGSGPALSLGEITWHTPMAPDQTPLPCCLPSFHSPSYLFPAGQSAWRLSQSQRTRDHVIHTIGPAINASAMLKVILPLAVVLVSCRAQCMHTGSGPALSLGEITWHTPRAPDQTPLPCCLPSFHSPSYLFPAGQSAWRLSQSQRTRDHVIHTIGPAINASAMLKVILPLAVVLVSCRAQCMHTGSGPALSLGEITWHTPMAPDQTPLPCCLPSFHSPSYLFPAGQSAWRLSQSQRTRDHVIHTMGPVTNASAMLKVILPLAVVLVSCRAQCMHTGSGPALGLEEITWHIPMAPDQTPLPFRLPSFHSPSYLFPAGQSAWRLSQGQRSRDHVIRTIGPGINASAMLKVILPLAVVLVSCTAECIDTESGPALSPK